MIRRLAKGLAAVLIIGAACALLLVMVLSSGIADEWLRDAAIRQIDDRTGGRAEMGKLSVRLFPIRASIENVTVHGREPADAPPLFHADRADVAVRILALFSRKFAIERLVVEHPQVAVEIDRDGKSNLPTPRARQTNRPWRDTVFNLRIADLELRNGVMQFNDRKTPLDVQGSSLEFILRYQIDPNGQDFYVGDLQMQQVNLAAKKWLPFGFGVSTKFILQRDALDISELTLKLPHSQLNVSAALPTFAKSDWNIRYRGRLSLFDLRTILRAPKTPDGVAEFSGSAQLANGQWTGAGYYRATGIGMHFQWFHGSGMETAGNFQIANRRLVVPNLSVKSFGGSLDGNLQMDFASLAFRTQTHLHGDDLHAVLEALNNVSFPVDALHWDASMEVDSVNTWTANFKHFRTTGTTHWSPGGVTPGLIPVTAQVSYDYSADTQTAQISQGEITTPRMRIDFNGPISGDDSGLEVNFYAGNLLEWNDFINAIRLNAEPIHVAGTAAWRGRVLGPIGGPTFVGHVVATHSGYEQYAWDSLEGDMEYSPDSFRLTQATIQRGDSTATLDVGLDFDHNWGFLPSSPWTMDVRVRRGSIADLQYIMGTKLPATGILSGRLQGSGTRAAPLLDADFVARELQAGPWHADRFAGQLHFAHDVEQLTNAELRENGSLLSGDVLYRPTEQEAEFNLAGSHISLDRLKPLQTSSLPIAGELSFAVHGSGPLRSPTGNGSLTLTNLKLGSEVAGNFNGQVQSDGRSAHLTIRSELPRGQLMADLDVGLGGDQPISGHLVTRQVDLDSLIVASLHIGRPTGHSQVDGTFDIRGALRRPDSIEVDADVTKLFVDYNYVQLTNDQDIRLTYRRNSIQIDQAHLHGTDTDFQISGAARFDQSRPLHLNLAGEVNLALAKSIFSDLDAQGSAELNVAIAGTMSKPDVTGEANVQNASAHYGDFPTGLTKVTGTLRFNKSQLLFDNVTAESGGGQLRLSGNMTYGEGSIRYEVRATTSTVRIRYPAGMSWLASGNLELSGDSNAAQISGRVQVQRLLFAQGTDVASFLASASESVEGPPTTSPFLQNLSLDVEGVTTPGAQIVWTGAHVEVDGDVRLRGTFDRPILLGHVHLLSGEMPFRGNTYQLARGDINFSDPFRLDPDLNIEASTTINQYQVTIDFTGRSSHLQMNYRSDPPLPDADIIALLALGSPGQESALRSGTGGNYGATALLSEAISSGIGGRIEHLFGISSFRVDPFAAETATESNATARVTIRQQVSPDLAITYSTNTTTNNQYQLIQVEYALKRNVSIVFLRDINGTYGCDVKFTKRIK